MKYTRYYNFSLHLAIAFFLAFFQTERALQESIGLAESAGRTASSSEKESRKKEKESDCGPWN